jgi:hypothetical protein
MFEHQLSSHLQLARSIMTTPFESIQGFEHRDSGSKHSETNVIKLQNKGRTITQGVSRQPSRGDYLEE